MAPAVGAKDYAISGWRPVEAAERYAVLDLIRGFAIFGVLLVNLLYFFRLSLFDHILHFHSHTGSANHAIDLLVTEFLEFKAFDLFSLTFGVGLAIQAQRAGSRGVGAEAFLARRLLILLGFGLCHMLLVSNVDILCLYAVGGLLVIPLLRLPVAAITVIGLAAIYLPSLVAGWMSLPPESAWREHVANATRVYSQGGFFEILEFRRRETVQLILPLILGVAQKNFGMLLLGVAAWRTSLIREPQRRRSWLWSACLVAGTIGIVNTTADVLSQAYGKSVKLPGLLASLGSNFPVALAYAFALLAWQRSPRVAALVAPVAAAGRMALTNYLTQSVVLALVFYGYGLGLFGRLDPVTAAVLGVTLYAAQLWFSTWWLQRYRFGPFEWLWRSLTYGRRQPMRASLQ
jgi:uncharacterized protein